MKRIFIIIILALSVSAVTFSQTDEFKTSYSFGIKQGINYSSVYFNPGIEEGIKLGYTGGLVYKYHNERLFGLQLELIFNQKGWKENLDTTGNSYSRTLNYIEFPMITQVIFGKNQTKIYVNLGTSIAYLLSENEDMQINDASFVREYYGNKVNHKIEYTGLGELGTYFNTSFGELQIGLRFQIALTDLFTTTSDSQYLNHKNMVWGLSASWFFLSSK